MTYGKEMGRNRNIHEKSMGKMRVSKWESLRFNGTFEHLAGFYDLDSPVVTDFNLEMVHDLDKTVDTPTWRETCKYPR